LGDSRGTRAAWVAIAAVTLGLRLAWAAWVPVAPVSDGNAYHVFASNLLEHGTFGWRADQPDAYWPPGAPALYAAAYALLGTGGAAVVALNLALALAKTLLAMSLAQRWFGERAALWCGALLAAWPLQIQLTTILSSEHPFDVALLAALWWFERRWRASALWTSMPLAVCLAAASLIRPTALPLVFGFGLLAVVARGASVRRALAHTAVAGIVLAALVAPWSLRNFRLFGRLVPISANVGANLWMGNNPDSAGVYMALPPEVARMDTAERDAYLGREARHWILAHPLDATGLALRKLAITHSRETIGVAWNARGLSGLSSPALQALKATSTAYWWLLLALALGGVAAVVFREGWRAAYSPPVLLWAYFAGVHAVTVAQDRYHLSSVPFVAALAALACAALERRVLSGRAAASTPTTRSEA
jgi:4-amino-4-deoxy-L-arabinose transferase-like glycosyltransferase